MPRSLLLPILLLFLLEIPACTPTRPPADPAPSFPRRLPDATLENLIRVSPGIYSGGEPRTGADLDRIAELGVKTVVSVDGIAPPVELARERGLRYVHIPIGYDRVGEKACLTIARLVREAPGPYYVHCHHGRHRGPAVAAIIGRSTGELDAPTAHRTLELARTGVGYTGLWADVKNYTPPAPDTPLPPLEESSTVDSFSASMSMIDRAFSDLGTPGDFSEEPGPPALQLREGFREALRTVRPDAPAELRGWLEESERAADRLEKALEQGDGDAADQAHSRLRRLCRQCHREYRGDERGD